MVKHLPANSEDARDANLIPREGKFPRGGNGNPLQYSCMKNFMGRGAWRATVQGVTKSGHDCVTEDAHTSHIWSKSHLRSRYS